MNFMLVPADVFSISILTGISSVASPYISFEQDSVGFLRRHYCSLRFQQASYGGCDPSSLVRVTEDLKAFLKPFQTLAIMN